MGAAGWVRVTGNTYVIGFEYVPRRNARLHSEDAVAANKIALIGVDGVF
jgi:hypothetical protein